MQQLTADLEVLPGLAAGLVLLLVAIRMFSPALRGIDKYRRARAGWGLLAISTIACCGGGYLLELFP
jgi:hypothetical protein